MTDPEKFRTILQKAETMVQSCTNATQEKIALNYLDLLQFQLLKKKKRFHTKDRRTKELLEKIQSLREKCLSRQPHNFFSSDQF